MIDNNSAATVIYSSNLTGEDEWFELDQLACSTDKERTILEDGYTFKGYSCRAEICIGSLIDGLELDEHTSVCNENQYVFYAKGRDGLDWVSFFGRNGLINSICGLGKEIASSKSLSFLSLAKANGEIDQLVYSLEIAPTLSQTVSSNAVRAIKAENGEIDVVNKRKAYAFETNANSTLVIGGYEPDYMKSDLTWFDTSDCPGGWNVTGTMLTLDDGTTLDTGADNFVVQPQLAYPFIGLPEKAFITLNDTIKAQNSA